MRSYIEEWFKKAIDKIDNEEKMMLEMVPITTEEIHKRTLVRK